MNIQFFVLGVTALIFIFGSVQGSLPPPSSSKMPPQKAHVAPQYQEPKSHTKPFTPLPSHLQTKAAVSVSEEDLYTFPGIIVQRDGRWIGSDQLINVTNKIHVAIELVKPETVMIDTSSDTIRGIVEGVLNGSNILILSDPTSQAPPLPLFQLIVMIYPLEDQYIVYMEGRLFESVKLERTRLDADTIFQAITWEDQNLTRIPKKDFLITLNKQINTIVGNFVKRYVFFNPEKVAK